MSLFKNDLLCISGLVTWQAYCVITIFLIPFAIIAGYAISMTKLLSSWNPVRSICF